MIGCFSRAQKSQNLIVEGFRKGVEGSFSKRTSGKGERGIKKKKKERKAGEGDKHAGREPGMKMEIQGGEDEDREKEWERENVIKVQRERRGDGEEKEKKTFFLKGGKNETKNQSGRTSELNLTKRRGKQAGGAVGPGRSGPPDRPRLFLSSPLFSFLSPRSSPGLQHLSYPERHPAAARGRVRSCLPRLQVQKEHHPGRRDPVRRSR